MILGKHCFLYYTVLNRITRNFDPRLLIQKHLSSNYIYFFCDEPSSSSNLVQSYKKTHRFFVGVRSPQNFLCRRQANVTYALGIPVLQESLKHNNMINVYNKHLDSELL